MTSMGDLAYQGIETNNTVRVTGITFNRTAEYTCLDTIQLEYTEMDATYVHLDPQVFINLDGGVPGITGLYK